MKPLDTLRVGIACDHAGYTLKEELKSIFGKQLFELVDFEEDEVKVDNVDHEDKEFSLDNFDFFVMINIYWVWLDAVYIGNETSALKTTIKQAKKLVPYGTNFLLIYSSSDRGSQRAALPAR